ncbi:hypothetical protein LIER_21172 [Lithospermum erythrorhizon]|uniref:Uncharacterized protein n=1 Tax=Lithospermum erythrorhizon TaxID=34254 RepID=A0AAV3QRQ0_LITER
MDAERATYCFTSFYFFYASDLFIQYSFLLQHVEVVLSSGDEARTEVVDSGESFGCMVTEVADSEDEAHVEVVDSAWPSDCMITKTYARGSQGDGAYTEVVDIEEPLDCVIMKAMVLVASSFTGVQHIESILRDSLRAAWSELCSFVEGKSHEDLLAEEEGIIASFEALAEFSRHDFSSQCEGLKVVFSATHDSEEKVARLWQELADVDTHVKDLRRQVAVREFLIIGLEGLRQRQLPWRRAS